MALSEHDQTVLREMEAALRADTPRPSAPRLASHRYLAAAIGLMIFGVASTAIGLRLEDKLGTGIGVLGFVFIVCSCLAAARSPLAGRAWLRATSRRWRTAPRAADASRPSHPAEEGP
jgi:hypothetical protein